MIKKVFLSFISFFLSAFLISSPVTAAVKVTDPFATFAHNIYDIEFDSKGQMYVFESKFYSNDNCSICQDISLYKVSNKGEKVKVIGINDNTREVIRDIAIDSNDRVYFLTSHIGSAKPKKYSSVLIYSLKTFKLVRSINIPATRKHALSSIQLDSSNWAYVSVRENINAGINNTSLYIFNNKGKLVKTISKSEVGAEYIDSYKIDSSGNVFVAAAFDGRSGFSDVGKIVTFSKKNDFKKPEFTTVVTSNLGIFEVFTKTDDKNLFAVYTLTNDGTDDKSYLVKINKKTNKVTPLGTLTGFATEIVKHAQGKAMIVSFDYVEETNSITTYFFELNGEKLSNLHTASNEDAYGFKSNGNNTIFYRKADVNNNVKQIVKVKF